MKFNKLKNKIDIKVQKYRLKSDMEVLRYWYTTYTPNGRNNKIIRIRRFCEGENE